MTNTSFIAFTSGALLRHEFDRLLPILKQEDSDSELTKEVKENNLFGVKTESARQRILTEIKRRLKVLPTDFWDFYERSDSSHRNLLLFFVVLKAYPLALDFHFEVVLAKWKRMEKNLDKFDLKMRMDELSSSNESIDSWSESTKEKVLTVFIRMIKESGLLKGMEITRPQDTSSPFWKYFIQIGESWFLEACLLSKTEREKLV